MKEVEYLYRRKQKTGKRKSSIHVIRWGNEKRGIFRECRQRKIQKKEGGD